MKNNHPESNSHFKPITAPQQQKTNDSNVLLKIHAQNILNLINNKKNAIFSEIAYTNQISEDTKKTLQAFQYYTDKFLRMSLDGVDGLKPEEAAELLNYKSAGNGDYIQTFINNFRNVLESRAPKKESVKIEVPISADYVIRSLEEYIAEGKKDCKHTGHYFNKVEDKEADYVKSFEQMLTYFKKIYAGKVAELTVDEINEIITCPPIPLPKTYKTMPNGSTIQERPISYTLIAQYAQKNRANLESYKNICKPVNNCNETGAKINYSGSLCKGL